MDTSHQEDTYQTDEQRFQKRREGGYLSDNYRLRILYQLTTLVVYINDIDV